MSEDAGAAAGTAEGAQPATPAQPAAPAAPAGGPPAAPSPGVADRSAEQMLAEAAGASEDGDGDGDGEDPAKALAKAQAEAKKWKDLSRKNEAKVKELSPAAQKLAEIEEANKTEIQRAADRAAAAEQRAVAAEQMYHRTLAAAHHDLGPDLISYITGSTEDEVNASAEALALAVNTRASELAATQIQAATAAAAANGGAQARPQRPVESLRPGALPAAQAAASDGNAFFRQALEARR